MEVLWRIGEASVRSVMEALNTRAKQRAYTTYMTIMARLDKKGLLRRKREGKTDVYWPRFDREQYRELRAAADVDRLLAEFGDAALVQFARAMDRVEPSRARALRRLARRQ